MEPQTLPFPPQTKEKTETRHFGPSYGAGGLFRDFHVICAPDGEHAVRVQHGTAVGELRHRPGQGFVGHFTLGGERFGYRADCSNSRAAAATVAAFIERLVEDHDRLRETVKGVILEGIEPEAPQPGAAA